MSKTSRARTRNIEKKRLRERKRNLIRYEVRLTCGCCEGTVHFKDDAAISAAFDAAGMQSNAVLTDDAGVTLEGVDTFYGWHRAAEVAAPHGESDHSEEKT